jgi:hypothetical protein
VPARASSSAPPSSTSPRAPTPAPPPLYASAARGLTSDPRAREGAARSELRLGHVDAAAAHLASDSAAAPDLRAAVDALRRGPALDLTFDRPLAPTWRIGQPLALHRDGGQGTFNLDALVPGEIASAPLRRARTPASPHHGHRGCYTAMPLRAPPAGKMARHALD